jgi:hypothetical protein
MSTDPAALQMYKRTIEALCLEELGRAASWTGEDLVAGILLQMAIEGQTGEGLRAWLHDQPEAIAHRTAPPVPPRPGPIARAPLPPFPAGAYDRALPFTPPGRDVLFYRGNFCGIRLPGAPAVVGGSADTDLVMVCLLDRYPREVQDAFLARYAGYGYTHLQRSLGHALPFGAWAGVGLDDYLDLSVRAQDAGLFADHWFLGGEALLTRDADATYWRPILDPLIDALLTAHAIDTACVGWQLDAYNAPGDPILSIIDYVAEKVGPFDIPLGTHWRNEAGGWWQTGAAIGDRFAWWRRMRNRVLWFHHQGDVDMDLRLYQDKLLDTLDPFGGDTSKDAMGTSGLFGDRPFGLIITECSAQGQFGTEQRAPWITEDQGDLRGYALCCTTSHTGAHVSGYGNGARMPDGSPL